MPRGKELECKGLLKNPLRHGADHTKTDVVVAEPGVDAAVTTRRPAVLRIAEPGTTAQHPIMITIIIESTF